MPKVKMKESLGSRLSTGAQDLAYAAAHGIEDLYGRKLRETVYSAGKDAVDSVPVVKTIRGRKNKPLDET